MVAALMMLSYVLGVGLIGLMGLPFNLVVMVLQFLGIL